MAWFYECAGCGNRVWMELRPAVCQCLRCKTSMKATVLDSQKAKRLMSKPKINKEGVKRAGTRNAKVGSR